MNKKKIIWLSLSIIIGIMIIFSLFANIYMINSTKNRIVSISDVKDKSIDAIIILGCKIEDNETPSLMLSKRLDMGIDVYNELKTKIILSGDNIKDDYNEVGVMKEYLLSSSIPEEDIYLDHAGINTYDSIYRAKNIFNAKKVVIITQKYHMYRALYLADKLDLEAYGVVANDIPQKFIMLKNEIREMLSRDKNFILGIFKPKSKYLGDPIPIN